MGWTGAEAGTQASEVAEVLSEVLCDADGCRWLDLGQVAGRRRVWHCLGMARETNQSLPSTLCQSQLLTWHLPWSSTKISTSCWRRKSGSSMVCHMVSMIQPRTIFCVPQLPSPLRSFFSKITLFRCVSSIRGLCIGPGPRHGADGFGVRSFGICRLAQAE